MSKPANGVTELDTFIPQDESHVANGGAKYEIAKGLDAEAANALSGEFDPFKARVLDHPVSASGTLTHLLKSCLGTGILSMPFAFKHAGLMVGIIGTIIESLICTHCAYILVVCAHELYRKSGKTSLSFAGVAEEACRRGPKWSKKYASFAKSLVDIGIFVTYFGTCSAYTVIVASNFQKVAHYYMGVEPNIRLCIALLLVPLIILCYVPNLKYLTPVSMISNIFMGLGLLITCYYLVIDLPPVREDQLTADIAAFPTFFSITIFALEAIGVVMPLENHMEKPQKFVGICGVLNQGMSGVTIGYIMLGFLGYLKFDKNTADNITLNLPNEEYAAQAVQILIALAVFGTFGLQFFICLEIVWRGLQHRYRKNPTLANYTVRTIMVVVAVSIAIAVPKIGPFIGLIGAFCFSILGLIIPVFIEIVTFWEKGYGKFNWRLIKNFIVVVTGVVALIFGSRSAIHDILKMYMPVSETSVISNGNVSLALENVTQSLLVDATTELGTTFLP